MTENIRAVENVETEATIASVSRIRSQFPALERRIHGVPVAYFDGPGGTQVPRAVAEAMTSYLFEHNANTHWAYPSSEETDVIIEHARDAVSALLNASPREVVFGANMTTLTFHLARALGRGWKAGDEIVVTELDHHANIAPWRALEIERGLIVRTARMIPKTAQLDYEHLESLLTPKTRLLAIGGASNAVGTVNDLTIARRLAKSAGALLFVDAVHLAPHQLLDVSAIGCDFLACSSYKFYGPHAGILFGRRDLLDALPFPKLDPAPDLAPERAETGTQNHEAIAGIGATIEFLASIGQPAAALPASSQTTSSGGTLRQRLTATFDQLHRTATDQVQLLWNGLASIRGVTLYGPGPSEPRTPTVSFTLAGHDAASVCRALARDAIFASHGDFYAVTVIERLAARDGLVRVGCACYTTNDEIARLLSSIERIAGPA